MGKNKYLDNTITVVLCILGEPAICGFQNNAYCEAEIEVKFCGRRNYKDCDQSFKSKLMFTELDKKETKT